MKRFISLGGVEYKSKSDVFDECRRIRGDFTSLNPRAITHAQDVLFLHDLVAMHPEASEKIGSGIASFRVASDGRLGVCFWIDRSDGTSTDFSFNRCLSPSPWRLFSDAARTAVQPQIDSVRSGIVFGKSVCAVSGELLQPGSTHVDHSYPMTFSALLLSWISVRNLNWQSVEVSREDGQTVRRFVDSMVESDWSRFHLNRATLRTVTAKQNLSHLRKLEKMR